MEDREAYRAAIADSIADAFIYAMSLCTALRIDMGTLLTETAGEVLGRQWKK
jgi:NTP pyrophosphatase (non-canonical NTP hydrolase)